MLLPMSSSSRLAQWQCATSAVDTVAFTERRFMPARIDKFQHQSRQFSDHHSNWALFNWSQHLQRRTTKKQKNESKQHTQNSYLLTLSVASTKARCVPSSIAECPESGMTIYHDKRFLPQSSSSRIRSRKAAHEFSFGPNGMKLECSGHRTNHVVSDELDRNQQTLRGRWTSLEGRDRLTFLERWRREYDESYRYSPSSTSFLLRWILRSQSSVTLS